MATYPPPSHNEGIKEIKAECNGVNARRWELRIVIFILETSNKKVSDSYHMIDFNNLHDCSLNINNGYEMD